MAGDTTSPLKSCHATDQITAEGELPTPLPPTHSCADYEQQGQRLHEGVTSNHE